MCGFQQEARGDDVFTEEPFRLQQCSPHSPWPLGFVLRGKKCESGHRVATSWACEPGLRAGTLAEREERGPPTQTELGLNPRWAFLFFFAGGEVKGNYLISLNFCFLIYKIRMIVSAL